jgi:hypothetical protein
MPRFSPSLLPRIKVINDCLEWQYLLALNILQFGDLRFVYAPAPSLDGASVVIHPVPTL